jgi:hypothetical protein
MNAIELIADKMRTNREHKGYTADHDDTHRQGVLSAAGACYLECATMQLALGDFELAKEHPDTWPFEPEAWKPNDDALRNLVHAGALIGAEIDRLLRARGEA